MKRLLLMAALLSACAPAAVKTVGTSPAVPATFQASFSGDGVIWTEGGRVTLARFPGFQKVSVQVPAGATAVGWQTVGGQMVGGQSLNRVNTPWVVLASPGLIVTADARPVSVQVGRTAVLSSALVYRQDGSAVGYDGGPAGRGLLGTPQAVVTGGDGLEYALQEGKLYRLGSGGQVLLSGAAQPYLYATLTGAATANAPTVATLDGRYTLTGTALERRDAAGVLLASVPHPAGLLGQVGSLIVTVQPGGMLRFFGPELRELRP